MLLSFAAAVITSALALVASSAFSQTGCCLGPEPTLSVRLYDHAEVPAAVLHDAIVEATRIFHAAGVHIIWKQPLVEDPEDRGLDMSENRTAPTQSGAERPYVVVRLIRGMPVSVLPKALGFALPFGRTGAHVCLFYDRVESLTRSVNTGSYVILGHALAHELGHVLLGSSEHTNAGLMQASWNLATYHLASAGLLAFRREEAQRLFAGVVRIQARHRGPQDGSVFARSAPSPRE